MDQDGAQSSILELQNASGTIRVDRSADSRQRKGNIFSRKHNVPVVSSLEELELEKPDYIVLAIKRGIVSEYLRKLFEKGILCYVKHRQVKILQH